MPLPPGPSAHAVVQTWRFIREPLAFFDQCRRDYGDIFTIELVGIGPSVHVCRPDLVRALLVAAPEQVHAGDSNALIRPLVGSSSVALVDEEAHARMRRVLNVSLHGPRMKRHGGLMQAATLRAVTSWRAGEVRPMLPVMQDISLAVILRVVFGVTDPARIPDAARKVMDMVLAYNAPLLLWPALRKDLGRFSPGGRFLRRRELVDAWIRREIAERRADVDPERADVLSLLATTTDDHGGHLSDEEIRDQLVTLFVAGQDTTSTALSWAMAYVHAHPEVRDRLQAEVDGLGPEPDPDALAALPYVGAVCQEALRVTPTVLAASRMPVRRAFSLGGYEVPAGAYASPNIYLVHRREELYPEPERFRPERFLEREFSAWEFLPWGGGARRCIGMALSLQEMKVILGTMMAAVRLDAIAPGAPRSRNRGMVQVPEGGARLAVREQRPLAYRFQHRYYNQPRYFNQPRNGGTTWTSEAASSISSPGTAP